MESRVRFNGRKTKPEGEKDRLKDILCGQKYVDFPVHILLVLSCFHSLGQLPFSKLRELLMLQHIVCL